MKDDNCIFCKLAAGDIPTNTVYEDDTFRVIMDANPATKGHSLIIPKDHFANLYEMDEEVAAKAMKLAKKMVLIMEDRELAADGIFVLRESMKPAQLVPGIKIEDNKVITDKSMASNIKGLYAAGDITGVPYQYVKAAGEGNVAALSAVGYLAALNRQ